MSKYIICFKEYYNYVLIGSPIVSIIFTYLDEDEVETILDHLKRNNLSLRGFSRLIGCSVAYVSAVLKYNKRPSLKFYLGLKYIGLDLVSFYIHDFNGYICKFDRGGF